MNNSQTGYSTDISEVYQPRGPEAIEGFLPYEDNRLSREEQNHPEITTQDILNVNIVKKN